MRVKVDLYRAFGVWSMWVVDPSRQTIDVYEGGVRRTLTASDTLTSDILPGFAAPVESLLAP
jgi:Uma2 family endonuclease